MNTADNENGPNQSYRSQEPLFLQKRTVGGPRAFVNQLHAPNQDATCPMKKEGVLGREGERVKGKQQGRVPAGVADQEPVRRLAERLEAGF